MQEIIVGVIVLGALVYLAVRYRRIYKGKSGCGCGQGVCPKNLRQNCPEKDKEA